MYRDARIELYKRDKYYYILIDYKHIEEDWINHIDRIEVIETDRKYLLILLGKD